jgi:hypothetical protein
LVSITVCAGLLVPTAPLANFRLTGETLTGEERGGRVTGEESVPAKLRVWRLFVEGVNLIWANADQPVTRRESKTTVRPKKRSVPYFADLELELWKQREGLEQTGAFILTVSSQVYSTKGVLQAAEKPLKLSS